jgi:hypothetical protein
MGIKCGAEFRERHALAIELDGKCAKAPRSSPVTAMNSVRDVLPGPAEKVVNCRG